jgi:hypothetical protein
MVIKLIKMSVISKWDVYKQRNMSIQLVYRIKNIMKDFDTIVLAPSSPSHYGLMYCHLLLSGFASLYCDCLPNHLSLKYYKSLPNTEMDKFDRIVKKYGKCYPDIENVIVTHLHLNKNYGIYACMSDKKRKIMLSSLNSIFVVNLEKALSLMGVRNQ